jgi:hypothetical protein
MIVGLLLSYLAKGFLIPMIRLYLPSFVFSPFKQSSSLCSLFFHVLVVRFRSIESTLSLNFLAISILRISASCPWPVRPPCLSGGSFLHRLRATYLLRRLHFPLILSSFLFMLARAEVVAWSTSFYAVVGL